MAITVAIRGTSKEKIYQELGLESLQLRRWYRKLAVFYKIYENKSPFSEGFIVFKSNTLKFIRPTPRGFL